MPQSKQKRTLYRSRDSLVGGVCGGIAHYFEVDTGVVRILTVVLTALTGGILALVYLVLWLVLPSAPESETPVEVDPDSIASDIYRQVVGTARPESGRTAATSATSATSAGQVPPPAPRAVDEPRVTVAQTVAPASAAPAKIAPDRSVVVGMVAGLALVSLGVALLVGAMVPELDAWQLWPVFLIVPGIARIVVPGRPGSRMACFVEGLMMLSAGVTALACTVGFIEIDLWDWLDQTWPLLSIMAGLFVLGRALHSPLLLLLGGIGFVAFCIAGLVMFSFPGPVPEAHVMGPAGNMVIENPFEQGAWNG